MVDGLPPTPSPPGAPGPQPSRPTGRQLLILLGGGFVLMFGGCLLAIANGTSNEVTAPFVIFAIAFFAGLLMMVAGAAAGVVKLFIVIFRKR